MMIKPGINALSSCADSRYTLVTMAAKRAREPITLECTERKRRTYMTEKNKKNNTDRLEITKYCKFCQKRTTHKETK